MTAVGAVQPAAAGVVVEGPITTSIHPNSPSDVGASTTTAATGALVRRSKAALRRGRGLESSLEFEAGLRNFWYPSEFSAVGPRSIELPVG